MTIRRVDGDKKAYLELLLLADEQEDMVDRYLDACEMYAALEGDRTLGEICFRRYADGTAEIMNLATAPEARGRGIGRALIEHVCSLLRGSCERLFVGTGDSPLTVPFYEKCGFREDHRIANFFTDNYDHPIIEAGVLLRDMVVLARKP